MKSLLFFVPFCARAHARVTLLLHCSSTPLQTTTLTSFVLRNTLTAPVVGKADLLMQLMYRLSLVGIEQMNPLYE